MGDLLILKRSDLLYALECALETAGMDCDVTEEVARDLMAELLGPYKPVKPVDIGPAVAFLRECRDQVTATNYTRNEWGEVVRKDDEKTYLWGDIGALHASIKILLRAIGEDE